MLRVQRREFLIILISSYLLLLFLHMNIDVGELGNDDFYFMREGKTYSYTNWITKRYETWSGRVSVETVLYFLFQNRVLIWKFLNPLVFILLFYTIARLVGGKNCSGLFTLSILSFSLMGFVSNLVLLNAAFWITGSINYLWPVAFGLYSILPFADAVLFDQDTRPTILHFAGGIFAALGQEQVSLFILAFQLIAIVLIFLKKKNIHPLLILQFALTAAGTVFMAAAPGNVVRLHRAVGMVFPGFDHFSLLTKILYGMQFLLPSFVVVNKILLLLFWIALTVYLLKNTSRSKVTLGVAYCLVAGIALLLLTLDSYQYKNIQAIIFNFDNLVHYDRSTASMSLVINNLFYRSALSLIFWSFELFVITPFGLFLVYNENKNHRIVYPAIFGGSILVLVILFFSPTIIGPGYRVDFMPSVLLIILFLSLVYKIFGETFFSNPSIRMGFLIFPLIAFLPYYFNFHNFSLSKVTPGIDFSQNSNRAMCNVDSFTKNGDYLIDVSGWAFTKGYNTNDDEKYLVFQASGQSTTFSTKTNSRPDVTKNLADGSNYDQSGFQGKINILDLPAGDYKVGVGLINKRNHLQSLCWIDKTVKIVDYTLVDIQ